MKKLIGATSHVMYYHKFTNIYITNAMNTIKIYDVPSNTKLDVDTCVDIDTCVDVDTSVDIDTKQLSLVWSKEIDNEEFEIECDAPNYMDHKNNDTNFRLMINGECVNSSKFVQKYLIEFDGYYVLKEFFL